VPSPYSRFVKMPTAARRVMHWLWSRLSAWRKRPLLAVLMASFYVAWGLRFPAQHGSEWDSTLARMAWILGICSIVVALVGGRRDNEPD